jgi:hypothetical protein
LNILFSKENKDIILVKIGTFGHEREWGGQPKSPNLAIRSGLPPVLSKDPL